MERALGTVQGRDACGEGVLGVLEVEGALVVGLDCAVPVNVPHGL